MAVFQGIPVNFQKKICIVWDVILIRCPKRCVAIVK